MTACVEHAYLESRRSEGLLMEPGASLPLGLAGTVVIAGTDALTSAERFLFPLASR